MQEAALCFNPIRRVGAQIEETLLAAGVDRGKVRQLVGVALSAVGLRNACRQAYPHKLSGGMRRRVLLTVFDFGGATEGSEVTHQFMENIPTGSSRQIPLTVETDANPT
jgi:hypothetical protein